MDDQVSTAGDAFEVGFSFEGTKVPIVQRDGARTELELFDAASGRVTEHGEIPFDGHPLAAHSGADQRHVVVVSEVCAADVFEGDAGLECREVAAVHAAVLTLETGRWATAVAPAELYRAPTVRHMTGSHAILGSTPEPDFSESFAHANERTQYVLDLGDEPRFAVDPSGPPTECTRSDGLSIWFESASDLRSVRYVTDGEEETGAQLPEELVAQARLVSRDGVDCASSGSFLAIVDGVEAPTITVPEGASDVAGTDPAPSSTSPPDTSVTAVDLRSGRSMQIGDAASFRSIFSRTGYLAVISADRIAFVDDAGRTLSQIERTDDVGARAVDSGLVVYQRDQSGRLTMMRALNP